MIHCKDCKWWWGFPAGFRRNANEKGRCKRYPPRVTEGYYANQQETELPITDADDYCGEAEPKEEK